MYLSNHSSLSLLPVESNCTYFKFFTTGENAVMFQKTTHKSESLFVRRSPTFSTHWPSLITGTSLFLHEPSLFCLCPFFLFFQLGH